MTTLEDMIVKYHQLIEEKIVSVEGEKKKLHLLIDLQQIKNKRLNGGQLSGEDIQKTLNILCWSSYAGCCGPEKGCPWRGAVSDVLGIDYQELYEVKKTSTSVFLKNNMR